MSLVAYGADSDDEHSDPEQLVPSPVNTTHAQAADEVETPAAPQPTAHSSSSDPPAADDQLTPSSNPFEQLDTSRVPPCAAAPIAPAVAAAMARLENTAPGFILSKIQASKQFRNPSIYQKLIEQMGIDETGSNYDPTIYDPKRWTDADHYKALRRRQDQYQQHHDAQVAAKRAKRSAVDFTAGSSTAGAAGNKPVIGAKAVDMKAAIEAARKRAQAIQVKLKQ
eukprot:m.35663 g.35663  ORF g.35663 m.35663 type:complete len:224 (+) comp12415_c0_seq1:72-743(+)